MTKKELLRAVAVSVGLSQKEVGRVFDEIIYELKQEFKENGVAVLPGIARFKRVHRSARKGRNPTTGQMIDIPAREAIIAKADAPKQWG